MQISRVSCLIKEWISFGMSLSERRQVIFKANEFVCSAETAKMLIKCGLGESGSFAAWRRLQRWDSERASAPTKLYVNVPSHHRIVKVLSLLDISFGFYYFFRLCRVFFFRSRREVLIDFVLKPVFDTENEFVTGMRDAEMKCNLRQPQLAVESSHRHRLQAEES